MKINVEVITGFLGSGKTTFINALLKETVLKDERVLVIQMEEGNNRIENINYNIKILQYKDDISKLSDFITERTKEDNYKKIIIEYNGTDDINELQQQLYNKMVKKICNVNSYYFIADTKSLKSFVLNMSDLIIPSLEISNLIVLNNYDFQDEEECIEALELVKGINLSGHVFTCNKISDINNKIKKSDLFNKRKFKKTIINIKDVFLKT